MLRFAAGFLTASVLFTVVAFLYVTGKLGKVGPDAAECAPTQPIASAAEPSTDALKKRARRTRKLSRSDGAQGPDDKLATIGDDIGWDDPRGVDMAGGEQQLSGSLIEAGFDSAMPKIRRCLVLVPAEGDIKGQLLFGMRVGSDGKPKAVNLSGPNVVTSGESGSCLRAAASAIRFPSFDGPDAVFKYPITLQ